jgi:O-antigen ligase
MQAWQVAQRIFQERPLTGAGSAAFLAAWSQYAPIDAGPHRYVAHNLELEVLGEVGLLGLFGMMAFVVASLWSAWRARNGEMGGEARAIFASLCGYLVCQQFSGYSLSWFLYALCAFAACCEHWAPRSKARSPAWTEGVSPRSAA